MADKLRTAHLILALVCYCLFGAAIHGVLPSAPPPATGLDHSKGLTTPVDLLLGQAKRERFALALRDKQYAKQRYSSAQYAAWGRQLVLFGQVKDPPIGPSPSRPLSTVYRCIHCHNLTREDVQLTVQDPEQRERMIRGAASQRPASDGPGLRLTPGTTLWGAVNRERFYNGHYRQYHRLRLADGSAMNPEKLADAVQICCRYCSAGRFPDSWELDGILAYLWELAVRLNDLDLPESTAKHILSQIAGQDEMARQEARDQLRRSYLRAAKAASVQPPVMVQGNTDCYADGTLLSGDPEAGKLLYESACSRCHGTNINPLKEGQLLGGDQRYHRYVWEGTERNGLYMPLFTAQRLSRRQVADIRAYLRSLPKSGP